MDTSRLRIAYWALDEQGRRADLLARVEQGSDATFARVFTDDPRAVEAVMELREGDAWRAVRSCRDEGGAPRVLSPP